MELRDRVRGLDFVFPEITTMNVKARPDEYEQSKHRERAHGDPRVFTVHFTKPDG